MKARADVVARFDGGNSTGVVDAYPGTAGDGWMGAWQAPASRALLSAQVLASSPLATGTGNYLDVSIDMDSDVTDSNNGQGCVARNYGDYYGEFSAALPHTIQFQIRIDENLGTGTTFTSNLDRYYFFDYPSARSGTAAACSWAVFAFGADYGTAKAKKWSFYNGLQDSGDFSEYQLVNTGMSVVAGTTYDFTITVDPANRLYAASVSNGSTTASVAGLGFRTSTAAVGQFLHFGGKGNQPADVRAFSLDSIQIPDNGGTGPTELPTADGFHGIWYYNEYVGEPYIYKYSGGFGTYPQQIAPHAYYSEEADKTFFVYGGTNATNSTIYHMVSYYDHATGQVARPRILLDKGTTDAHDNPCIVMDGDGYLYVFSSSHGTARPSYISRSVEPYAIDRFETVVSLPSGTNNNFSYAQPLYIEGQGFMFLHTLYTSAGRTLCYNTSSDGIHWDHDWTSRPQIARMPGGQYQISAALGQKVVTAFNYLEGGAANNRTNLYYMQTTDMGDTWTTVDGVAFTTPVTTVSNAALVHDYQSEDLLVYLKNIQFDDAGNPILYYLTTSQYEPGPEGDPRTFHTAHWNGASWTIKDAFTTDHAYDYGALNVEENGTWRVIAPTGPGPQEYCTGGEMEMWISRDEGDSWELIRELTYDSDDNHTYARQPRDANDEFYAFWADGNALAKSDSQFYFTDRLGTGVWKLPEYMAGDFATPELVYIPVGAPAPGDANGDGVVDQDDAAILAENWGRSDWAAWSQGDFNRDGAVNAADASILAANWGHVAESTIVPEPAVAAMLLGLAAALAAFRRRGHTIE
ncbi:MAG: BNR-4 repeat-containing protein [Pirellulales bacterium]|nr:BNR-4 repeat-containing protein [Pirellulales bacterium]